MSPIFNKHSAFAALLLFHSITLTLGQSYSSSGCSTTLTPTNSIAPTVASGYRVALVATGLTKPRSLKFDSKGDLLVVQQGLGIVNLAFADGGGICLTVKSKTNVIQDSTLNHGIALSQDGKTLYASSAEAAYSWAYDPDKKSVGQNHRILVTGMTTDDHTTRTLLLSQRANGTLVIGRGSTSNVDFAAESLSSGHSQVKAFNLNNVTSNGYDFNTEGTRLGWGLRNDVGIVEHPATGGIFTVENSVDQLMRDGQDIHQDNPGEEMNFLGYLNGTEYAPQGSNFGYPYCFAAWAVDTIPNNANLTVGSQFAMGDQNNTINDTYCAETSAPRLTFQAHMAPLDIVFNNSGTEAWVAFHGSWDRTSPVGYKLSVIPFTDGEPVAASNNKTSTTDIFANADNSKCPDHCFRPVGIAFDNQGRLFVSSDATGEIYVVVKDQAMNPTGSTSTSTAPSASSSRTSSAEKLFWPRLSALLFVLVIFWIIL